MQQRDSNLSLSLSPSPSPSLPPSKLKQSILLKSGVWLLYESVPPLEWLQGW